MDRISPSVMLLLVIPTGLSAALRSRMFNRSAEDWALDVAAIPAYLLTTSLQFAVGHGACRFLFPGYRASVEVEFWHIPFVFWALDYLWYWNHRLLHGVLWNWHLVHHSARVLDFIASERNTFGSTFLMARYWLNGAIAFFVDDPVPTAIVGFLGIFMHQWNHSSLDLPRGSRLRRVLGYFLCLPEDHAWHHSRERPHCNYGISFNWWDRLHGTWYRPGRAPEELGLRLSMSTWRKAIFPFFARGRRRSA